MKESDLEHQLALIQLTGTWPASGLGKIYLLNQLGIFTRTDDRFDRWLINRHPDQEPAELYEHLTIETVARYVQETAEKHL